ncbi:MAG: hypothetical protein FJW69_07295 [Actinobacteria bacterium]|nr:hypothetical protein [Actinomycetota bacterium]
MYSYPDQQDCYFIKGLKLKKSIIIQICILALSLSILFTGCNNGAYQQSANISEEQLSPDSNIESVQETGQDEKENTTVSAEDYLANVKIEIITVDKAYEIYSSDKEYLFVDVRNEGEYNRSHIKGAILIPVKEIEANLDKIPKDKIIVVYCNGKGCEKSSKNTGSQRVPPGLWCWWTGYI